MLDVRYNRPALKLECLKHSSINLGGVISAAGRMLSVESQENVRSVGVIGSFRLRGE